MYSIYANGACIYSDVFALESMKVISPKLTMEDNSAGSLTMTLPKENIGYDSIARLTTDISVQKDGRELWAGRVLRENKDFWNNRILYCEGELAFFNDSTQPPKEYAGLSIRAYLENLIEVHNSKVPANRRFTLGAVTVVDKNFPAYYTNYEKTIALLNALVEEYGGHLRVRKVNGVRYLDYLKDYPNTCSQVIQFGANLIDFTRKWDSTEFATVIVPLGSRLNDSPIKALDAYLTVEDVNQGSIYVQSDEAMQSYGWIEKVVSWDDVTDPAVLLEKAKTYLTDLQFDNMELELSALDLHYLNINHEAVNLLDEIRVISRPHGLDRLFPVTKLEIPLDSPENTQFTMGDTVKTSLTSANNQISSAILKKIEGLPKAHSLLEEAKNNATAIMNMATTGYITITKDKNGSDALYISDIRDYTKAKKLWKWNMKGLGYSEDGGNTFGTAITMDGSIVADYITSGVLNADLIRAGTLKDYGGNFILDLATGNLTMTRGSISIGNGEDEKGNSAPNFSVDEDGNLIARKGTFAGTLLAATGSFGGIVTAEDFRNKNGQSMFDTDKLKISHGYLDLYGLTVYKKVKGTETEPGKDNQVVTFKIDDQGNVTINGQVTMGEGSSIDWSKVEDNGAKAAAQAAQGTANEAVSAASDAQSDVNRLRDYVDNLDIPVLPQYITTTKITSTEIESPTITGNDIVARKYFAVKPNDFRAYGYMGLANGMDAGGNTTYGVALSHEVPNGLSDGSCYVIVTNAGVRMQAPGHSITVTSTGCRADGKLIGGSTVAVWG